MSKIPLIKVKGSQNHHLYKRLDVFWLRIFKTGKGRLEESLKTTLLGEARIARDVRVAEFLGMKPRFQGKGVLVEDKFPEFIEIKSGKAKGTVESLKGTWENHLKDYFGGMLLDEVTNTEWLKYVNHKREKSSSRKFFNDKKYLAMFLHWLHRDGLIEKLHKLDDVDPEVAEGRTYTDAEIKVMLDNARDELKLQILMGLTMGMRVGEILSLEWSQVDFDKNTIYLPATKTKIRKERTFGISAACFDLLLLFKESSLGTAVFPSPEDHNVTQSRRGNKFSWATCKRNAGLPKAYRFHWLRHTFLTRAFKESVNPALICKYAGLSLEEAEKTYLHFGVEDTRVVADLVKVQI